MSSIDCVLRPRSIAVVGASDDIHKIGGRPLHYLHRYGYAGDIYAVNPRAGAIQGHEAYASMQDLPQIPDLAILAVPSSAALEQIQLCGRLGVRGAIIFASGYAETGSVGAQAERDMANAARSTGMRLVGPNTIGPANFATGAVMSFASVYGNIAPLDGPVAIVSQSGAVGVSVYASVRERGVGVRYVCATGNQADVDVADYLDAVADDPGVRQVLVYLEDVGNDNDLQRAVQRLRASGVEVVILASAFTEAGRKMARLHTGSRGVSCTALDQIQALGCRCVRSIDELGDSVKAPAASMPGPAAPRVCIVSNSGASCVLGADACDDHGLPLSTLAAGTVDALDSVLPSFSLSRNPIDLTAMLLADPSLLPRAVALILADEACDALALSLVAARGRGYDIGAFARHVAQAAATARKTVVFSSPDSHARTVFLHAGIASFRSEHAAIGELRALHTVRA